MSDLNSLSVVGRLTRDAEAKVVGMDSTPLVTFSLANNIGWGTNASVNYFTVNLWGKGGKSVLPYLTKGQQVALTGTVKLNSWTDKTSGAEKREMAIDTNGLSLVGGKKDNTAAQVIEPDEVLDDEEFKRKYAKTKAIPF
jgi:single-strand DNA-binding protein